MDLTMAWHGLGVLGRGGAVNMDILKQKLISTLLVIILAGTVSWFMPDFRDYISRPQLPESKIVQDKSIPVACRYHLALMYATQNNSKVSSAALMKAGSVCKATLADLACHKRKKNRLEYERCLGFYVK